ncbi:MAG: ribonuclease III [Sphingobacteriales bacterium]|nr:MAG: ribonuclease III [Sphingobacteriales bacterium]
MLKKFLADRKFKTELAELIGFTPSKIALYKEAFTHKSAIIKKRGESNERLEFLGDAVLSLVIGAHLYEKFPENKEGFLSQLRARIVNRDLFNELGQKLNLYEWMQRVAPHTAKLEDSPDLIGNAFEALVGAIFLDKGYKKAEKFFENKILAFHLDVDEVLTSDKNYKSRLLEWGQKNNQRVVFQLKEAKKVDKKLEFEVEVYVNEELLGFGTETKKRKAEQMAAREALDALHLL